MRNPERVAIIFPSDSSVWERMSAPTTGDWIYDPDKIIDVSKFQDVQLQDSADNSKQCPRKKDHCAYRDLLGQCVL